MFKGGTAPQLFLDNSLAMNCSISQKNRQLLHKLSEFIEAAEGTADEVAVFYPIQRRTFGSLHSKGAAFVLGKMGNVDRSH